MATTEASTTLNSRLMTLPAELRNTIYRMLLTYQYAYPGEQLEFDPLHPAILRCNRQLYKEAKQILLGENIWVIVNVDARLGPLILDRLRHVSRTGADAMRYPALRIDLTMSIAENAPPREHMVLLMGNDSIGNFIQVLWRISGNRDNIQDFRAMSLSLTLCETPFHAKSKLESRCLKPFGLLHGLRSLSIRGQVNPAYVKEIMDLAESGVKDMLHIGHISNLCIKRGHQASLAGKPMTALARHIYGLDYLRHVLALRMSGVALSAISDIFTITRWRLETGAHIIKVKLDLGRFKDVKISGTAMLTSGILSAEMRVLVSLCVARAHRALGEREQESRMFAETLSATSDQVAFMAALIVLFLDAPLQFARLLNKEKFKARQGEAINLAVIRIVWETL